MMADENEKRILGSIKLAADDLSRLRRIDVYRVLQDAAQQELLTDAAKFICEGRPELAAEVHSCLEELGKPGEESLVGPVTLNQLHIV